MDFLQVKGNEIVDQNEQTVKLRGLSVGGWMNTEDFINGFSGSDHTLRLVMSDVLGKSKAEFFFERMMDHFLNESDIAYMKSLGATVVRLPLNYRHFEDDETPFTYKESGFSRLDTMLQWCEKHGLYAILDLHAVQGWQNVHWHSDNDARHNLFWHNPHFQDRFVSLWEQFAVRYKDKAVVAGYNLMNEPCVNIAHGDMPWNNYWMYQPDWERINRVYQRAVDAIRAIDPLHIIFLEGDKYSTLFSGFAEPFADNLVYSSHNYTSFGFGPGAYPSEQWNRDQQVEQFLKHEGTVFTQKHHVPLWVGEFGSVYNGDAAEIPDRLHAMDDQIGIFNEHGAHWTTWTYKDVGVMGLTTLNPESEYMQRVSGFIKKKIALGTDDWMRWMPSTPVKDATAKLAAQIASVVDDPESLPEYNQYTMQQTLLCFYTGSLLQPTYAKLFKGLSEQEIDRVLSSFSFQQCQVNKDLEDIICKYTV